MKRIALFTTIFVLMAAFVWAGGHRERVPKVRYIEPKGESVVDLKGKENLTFSWKGSPTPAGGRMNYKFELYKGFGYEQLVNELLDPKVFSIDVPADVFEDGVLYTWQVRQRDARRRFWSMDHRWSFTVSK